jgi:hypothetical protein
MSITDEAFNALKLRYKAAFATYKSCVQALSDIGTSSKPSAHLLANEAKALHELTEASRCASAARATRSSNCPT